MKQVQIKFDKFITGFVVKTNNHDEICYKNAQIPKLWKKFFDSKLVEISDIYYGVYYNYTDKHFGDYDILVGVDLTNLDDKFDNVLIENGKYLCFEADGESAKITPMLWQEIWTFFQDCSFKRAYKIDFEKHSKNKVEIYISIL
ncbi:GyrI-like domain-containing protein [Campylobacter geochelonis]|uniref:GyrI-like domain-containing protein n=1 Tax=Campylobacter geochelonis TaxID=1780362 RepID=UPI00077098E2|nr:effector binding domain-containing protein [Campylobacter geochelonis]CZE47439.1 transcription activator effector binding subunit [Campylobacter geochelonis]